MHISLTQLRGNLYQWIDQLIATGEPIEIERKGAKIKIMLAKNINATKKKKFVKHTNVYAGEAEDLIHMDWSNEWFEKNATP